MNIAVVGQKMYDFQDLYCVDTFLQYSDEQHISLLIEPAGREDAALSFERDGQQVSFDIQIKGAEGEINITKLADYLFHFPDRRDSDSLFERLLSENNLIVLMVMSGRCNDDTSRFIPVTRWSGSPHPKGKIRKKDASALRVAFQKHCSSLAGDSALTRQRKDSFIGYLANCTDAGIQAALSRLMIVENVTSDQLRVRCQSRLQSRYHIPADLCQQAISGLIAVVKQGKTQQQNIAEEARSLLQHYRPLPLMPKNYVLQGQEAEWQQHLTDHNVLLLSGPPRVGKSFAAAYLAAQFSSLGYEVASATDIQQAERLLLDPEQTWRLVLLDDPFGSSGREVEDYQGLDRLSRLITRLSPGRKLIVAQAQEHLLELSCLNRLEEVRTSQLSWYDCGKFATTFVSHLWQQLCQQYSVVEPLATRVQQGLESGELLIEAGCLLHLAVNAAQLEGAVDAQRITTLARQDAYSVGQAMAQSRGKNILQALAVGSSPRENMALEEMAYLINGSEPLFAISHIIATGATFGGSDNAMVSPSFPEYLQPDDLSDEQSDSVDYYERRRVIDSDQHEHYYYTHPFYRSAAESLLNITTIRERKKVMSYLERGLFCLSPRTSRATARILRTVFAINKQPVVQEELFRLAIRALDCSYPSTRDICYHFLVDHLSYMPDDFSMKLPEWVRKVTFTSLDSMQWHQGEAWLPMGQKLIIRQRNPWKIYGDDARPLSERLNQETLSTLSPEEAWQALSHLKWHRTHMNKLAISRLLSFDEALIRASAVEVWLSASRTDDAHILDRILNDNHPAVALAVLETAVKSWENYSDGQQDILLDGLQRYAAIPALALVLIESLVLFDREEHAGCNPPWPLFATIMSQLLLALPAGSLRCAERLVNSIEVSARTLPTPAVSLMPVMYSWVDYLERSAVKSTPSAWTLSIAHILVALTQDAPERRGNLFQRLIALPGTGTRVVLTANFTNEWCHLTEAERTLFLDNLHTPYVDREWLQATVLTRSQVPDLLLANCAPDIDFSSPREVLDKLPPALLACALLVYIGEISELGASATHHSGAVIWPQIIDLVAQQPDHALFRQAWQELISRANDAKLAELILLPANLKNEQIFDLMLANAGIDDLPLSWDALLNAPENATLKPQWFLRLAQEANRIVDKWHYVHRWLGERNVDDFLQQLPEDQQLINLVSNISDVGDISQDAELKGEILKLVTAMMEKCPPNVSATCLWIIRQLNNMGFTPDECDQIEQMRIFLLNKKQADTHYSRLEIYNWQ